MFYRSQSPLEEEHEILLGALVWEHYQAVCAAAGFDWNDDAVHNAFVEQGALGNCWPIYHAKADMQLAEHYGISVQELYDKLGWDIRRAPYSTGVAQALDAAIAKAIDAEAAYLSTSLAVCCHCYQPPETHGPGGKCLFDHSTFQPLRVRKSV